MATQVAQCRRVVVYLPCLRTAVIRCRAFSSSTSNKLQFGDDPTATTPGSVQWPQDVLGLLSPIDKRFPLPGLVGACGNSRLLHHQDVFSQVPPTSTFSLQEVLPPLPGERHTDIADQFLTSIDEIDEGFLERGDCTPSPMDKLECVAHKCPNLLRKDFQDLFPDRNLMESELTVITLSLKTKHDMMLWSSEVEEEREALLEAFIQGAVEICQSFEDAGFWADFVDPASGKPFKACHTNFTLFETDERYHKLGFEIRDLGCCKVISHPIWGTHAYIGSLFTSAPLNHPLINNLVHAG